MIGIGDLGIPRTFRGRLSHDGNYVSISFSAHIDKTGTINLVVDEFASVYQSMFIISAWHNADVLAPGFTITGQSEDDYQFESNDVYFTSIGTHSDSSKGVYHKVKTDSVGGTFSRSVQRPEFLPTIASWIRGFGCVPRLETTCPLGSVAMTGPAENQDTNDLSGCIMVQAVQPENDVPAWCKSVDELILFIRRVMSFAAGGTITSPVIVYRKPSELLVIVRPEGQQNRVHFPVCHVLQRQHIFEVAIKAYFDTGRSAEIRKMWTALDWICIDSYYSEVRLINAITALENLINVYSKDTEWVMSNGQFRRLRKYLESHLDTHINQHTEIRKRELTFDYMRSKLPELQRRPIKSRLKELISTLSVPMTGIDETMIDAAYSARNRITHTGLQSVIAQPQPHLWTHICVIRELVTRIVFCLLGYDGHYISYINGIHYSTFPPVAKPNN